MAEPPPITIKIPTSSRTIIIGANQNFFRALRNPNKSFKKSIMFYSKFSLIQILLSNYLFPSNEAAVFYQKDNFL
jgi:hypothetical protein